MRVTLVGLPGCHLCDEARLVVERVCDRLGEAWEERWIDSDPELYDLYRDEIPVVLVDGAVLAVWRVREAQLEAALT